MTAPPVCTNRFYVPATSFTKSPRTPKSADTQHTHTHTHKKRFRLALAMYYLPKVLRPLPTYLLLSLALSTYVRSNRYYTNTQFIPTKRQREAYHNTHQLNKGRPGPIHKK